MLPRPRVVLPFVESRRPNLTRCTVSGVLLLLLACLAPLGAFAAPMSDSRLLTPAPMPASNRVLEVEYEGTLELAGHYRRPGDTRSYRSRQRYLLDAGGTARLDWTTQAEGDSGSAAPETFVVIQDSVFHRDDPSAPWRLLSGERAELARMQTLAGVPWKLANDPRFSVAKLVPPPVTGDKRATPDAEFEAGDCFAAALAGRERSVWLENRRRARVAKVRDRIAHPRLGDVDNTIAYRYADKGPAPRSMKMTLHERDHHWTFEQRLVSYRDDADSMTLLARPASFEPAVAPDTLSPELPLFHELAPGVWSADMEDLDTRSLVVVFADHLAVIEMAVGSANGERLVDAIERRWPDQPIRHALFSHHNPHYAGGVRALAAAGATIITTAGNEALVRELLTRPWTLAPDRLARASKGATKTPEIRTFTGRFELADSTQRLVAVDIGARSDHTEEFVVFSFPRVGLVFETEQGWVTAGGTVRAIRRAEGFLRTLDAEKIAAQRLVQSWPMRGEPREQSRAQLEELISKRKK